VIENGKRHFGMMPVGGIWKNKNFRKNVKPVRKFPEKQKIENRKFSKWFKQFFFWNGKSRLKKSGTVTMHASNSL